MQSLGVVIPMFNEEAGAEQCVDAVLPVLAGLGREARLIAVEDGSADRTLRDARAARPRAATGSSSRRTSENRGYGAALRTGAEAAQRLGLDWVLFMDSDLTNPPSDIPRFAELIDGPVDYVKASRFEPGGSMSGVPSQAAVPVAWPRTASRGSPPAAGSPIRRTGSGRSGPRRFCRCRSTSAGFAIIMEELVLGAAAAAPLREPPDGPDEPRREPATDLLRLQPIAPLALRALYPHARCRPSSAMEAARADTTTPFACRACGARDLELMIDFGELPLAGGFLDGPEEAAREERYPLVVHVCRNCALVQIVEPVDPDVLFQDYSFSASTIPGLVRHFDDYAQWLVDRLPARARRRVRLQRRRPARAARAARRRVPSASTSPANITELARERGHTAITGAFTPGDRRRRSARSTGRRTS